MSDYRIYFLGTDDRIMRAVEMRCGSDHDAAAEVRRLAKGATVELWQRARFVGRYAVRAN